MIRSSELIAIFDFSIEQSSKLTKQFITEALKDKKLENKAEEAKSIIITQDQVYYSPISSTTLKKRTEQNLHDKWND